MNRRQQEGFSQQELEKTQETSTWTLKKNRGIELFGDFTSNPAVKFSDTEKDKKTFTPFYNWLGSYGGNKPIYLVNDPKSKVGKFWMWDSGGTQIYMEKHGVLEEYDSKTGYPHLHCNMVGDFTIHFKNSMAACSFGGQLWPGTSSSLYFAMEMIPHLPDIEDCMREMFEDMSADGKIFEKRK